MLLPIISAGVFIGLIFDVFNKQTPYVFDEIGKNEISSINIIGATGKSAPINIIGATGTTGVIGTRDVLDPDCIVVKDGKTYVVNPRYIPLYDGKWIADGRNFKRYNF